MAGYIYLLSPISSIAFQGGPIKTNPASVHFRAKAEFSLSCTVSATQLTTQIASPTYKAVARVNALTALLLGNVYNTVTVQIGGHRSEVEGEGGAQGMLGPAIGVGV